MIDILTACPSSSKWRIHSLLNSQYYFLLSLCDRRRSKLKKDAALIITSSGRILILWLSKRVLLILNLHHKPFSHSATVRSNNSTRERLGWTFSYICFIFVHLDLDLTPLLSGIQEKSVFFRHYSDQVQLSFLIERLLDGRLLICLFQTKNKSGFYQPPSYQHALERWSVRLVLCLLIHMLGEIWAPNFNVFCLDRTHFGNMTRKNKSYI